MVEREDKNNRMRTMIISTSLVSCKTSRMKLPRTVSPRQMGKIGSSSVLFRRSQSPSISISNTTSKRLPHNLKQYHDRATPPRPEHARNRHTNHVRPHPHTAPQPSTCA